MKSNRLIFIKLFLAVFAAALIGRLFYWQVIKHSSLVEAAKNQKENTVFIIAKRGKI
jgi:cell division protein FtsI/penicillin-binding protein 2